MKKYKLGKDITRVYTHNEQHLRHILAHIHELLNSQKRGRLGAMVSMKKLQQVMDQHVFDLLPDPDLESLRLISKSTRRKIPPVFDW